ncbi:MAG: TraR/DksA family transcriptional regulator [Patescibacteria group bacterium]|jgi:hypothetical protein
MIDFSSKKCYYFWSIFPGGTMLSSDFLASQKEILREKLRRYLEEWPHSARPPVHLALKQRVAVPYILAALARIKEGSYGICADCGEEIPIKRLVIVPGAIRCVECESQVPRRTC